jgi:signal transduction histidine kinase
VLSGKTIDDSEDERTSAQFIHLIRETEKSTEISIHLRGFEAEAYDALPISHRSFLYNALMEGLTNGLRHGGATSFEVSLTKSGGRIEFILKDSGKGFRELTFGYGLSKISRDARRFGGQLRIESRNGCEMRLQLPVPDGKEPEGVLHG